MIKNPENSEILELVYQKEEYKDFGLPTAQPTGRSRIVHRIIVPGEVVRIGHLAQIKELQVQPYPGSKTAHTSKLHIKEIYREVVNPKLAREKGFEKAKESFRTLAIFLPGRVLTANLKKPASGYDVEPVLTNVEDNAGNWNAEPLSLITIFPGLKAEAI